jgi:hypothetical protein
MKETIFGPFLAFKGLLDFSLFQEKGMNSDGLTIKKLAIKGQQKALLSTPIY